MANFFTGTLALGTGSTSFVELAAPGYARVPIVFGALASGAASNVSGATFNARGGLWPAATQYALIDASGTVAFWWNKRVPVTLADGKTHTIGAGALALTLPDIATLPGNALLQWAAGVPVGTTAGGDVVMTGPSGASWSAV